MTDDEGFIDAESSGYYGSKELSFRQILLNHLSRIMTISSQEFHGGYWKTINKVMGGGGVTERVYIPNTREQYINAINALSDILLPHFDDEMIEQEKRLDDKEKNRYDELMKEGDEKNWEWEHFKQNVSAAKVPIKRELFRELSKFMRRKNYLETAVYEE